jgi:hypothetical protein
MGGILGAVACMREPAEPLHSGHSSRHISGDRRARPYRKPGAPFGLTGVLGDCRTFGRAFLARTAQSLVVCRLRYLRNCGAVLQPSLPPQKPTRAWVHRLTARQFALGPEQPITPAEIEPGKSP